MNGDMKAAILEGPRRLRLREIDAPGFSPDQVLLRVRACGICGSDVQYYNGINPWSLHTLGVNEEMPGNVILGHEVAGEVARLGVAVSSLRRGDRVGVIAFRSCGTCYQCRAGSHNLCANMLHIGHDGRWGDVGYIPGGLAEFMPVWEDKACPLPGSITFVEATQLDGLAVCVHAINRSRIRVGDSVAVIGSGPIGLMAMQVAKAFGAGQAISIDRRDKPLDLAEELGASFVINSEREDPVKEVMRITRGLGVNVVVDTVGSKETVIQDLRILSRGGRAVLLAGFIDAVQLDLRLLSGERSIASSSNNLYHEYSTAIDLMGMGKVRVKPFITHVLPLSGIEEAFEIATRKEEYDAIKVVVTP